MAVVNAKTQAKKVLKRLPQKQDFTKLYGTFANYWGNQSPLSQEAVRLQLEKQFEPEITQGIGGIKQEFAKRGLYRSGIRAGNENRYLADTADRFGTQAEQLLAQREAEARNLYSEQQRLYEKSPTGYKGYDFNASKGYVVGAPQAQQGVGDIYGGAGSYQGGEGPSYLQAYRDYLKKKTPDYYKKFYGA